MKHIRVPLTLFVAVAALLAGCSGGDDTASPKQVTTTAKGPASATHTVADYLGSDTDLTTLASAVKGTALAKTLAGPGPYTLFAPTNEAFAALPAGTLEALKKDGQLGDVLGLHVAKKKLTAADLVPLNGKTIDTVTGPVHVVIDGRTLKIGGAPVTRTDILTSNGVIHVIGAVITPKTA